MYLYKGYVERVVDGDTFDIVVDLGFNIKIKQRFRLNGIDTPEIWRPSCDAEYKHGLGAKNFVIDLIEGKDITIKTYKVGKYGRYICDIILDNNQNLTELLIENNFSKLESYSDDDKK